jgi:pimeloyl-ACP methyl ester carboxylesterase
VLRFGASYNPASQPYGIKYYVDVFMVLIKQLDISKFHVFGHHSGASIALEMAVLHCDQVLSLSVCGAAFMNTEEQREIAAKEIVMYNKPVEDGSHFLKVWNYLEPQGNWNVVDKHFQALDALRAYEGRLQAYTCVFSQPILELVKHVKCPFLVMSSEEDLLFPFMPRAKEAVSFCFKRDTVPDHQANDLSASNRMR